MQGNGDTSGPFLSGTGRYVAFYSAADNLVSGDTNTYADVFVHDRQSGETTRVSVDSLGGQANNESLRPRPVPPTAATWLLSPGPPTWWTTTPIFTGTYSCATGRPGATTRVSVSSSGAESDQENDDATISGDGRMVAFSSRATTPGSQ